MSAIVQLAESQPSACGPDVFKASRKKAQAVNVPGNPGGCSQALNPCKTKCCLSRFGQIFRKHGSETASAKNRS